MPSSYQHGEKTIPAPQAVANKVASNAVAYPAVPAPQKKSPEEDELQMKSIAQLAKPEQEELQMKSANLMSGIFQRKDDAVPPKANRTGMPDQLKSGIENLSGFSMDDVKVHYNSDKPAQLNALAYAQGTNIHIGPGQERHLPHEAWHVVQQKQGRVRPTLQMKGITKRASVPFTPVIQLAETVTIEHAKKGKKVTWTAETAANEAIDKRHVDAKHTDDLISFIKKITRENFETINGFFEYIDENFKLDTSITTDASSESDSSSGDESEGQDNEEDNDDLKVKFNEGSRKEDTTADKRKGKGRKRDIGTNRFKTDHDFRDWVHGLKGKNHLDQHGVLNRTGGEDNLTGKELRKLEISYDKTKSKIATTSVKRSDSTIQKKSASTSLPSTPLQFEMKSKKENDNTLQSKKENITTPFMPIHKKENNTGLPDNLKTGIENLSGFSMNDVRVYYNSDKPAQLNAFAYAQGTDIHIAPLQERYLPHEAWHIVQQKQGRVKATMQMKGVAVNYDKGLEKEADSLGQKAMYSSNSLAGSKSVMSKYIPAQRIIQLGAKYDNLKAVIKESLEGECDYEVNKVTEKDISKAGEEIIAEHLTGKGFAGRDTKELETPKIQLSNRGGYGGAQGIILVPNRVKSALDIHTHQFIPNILHELGHMVTGHNDNEDKIEMINNLAKKAETKAEAEKKENASVDPEGWKEESRADLTGVYIRWVAGKNPLIEDYKDLSEEPADGEHPPGSYRIELIKYLLEWLAGN